MSSTLMFTRRGTSRGGRIYDYISSLSNGGCESKVEVVDLRKERGFGISTRYTSNLPSVRTNLGSGDSSYRCFYRCLSSVIRS